MSQHAILLHGRPSKEQWEDVNMPSASNYYWLPWAQKQLALKGIPTETPEVPNAWIPHYATWQSTFEKHPVTPETILIGHSCGAGFIVRWLSEHSNVTAGKVILVAPWVDSAGDPGNEDAADFMNFSIDQELSKRTAGITIINSDNDVGTIQRSVQKLRATIQDAKYIELHDRQHFYDDLAMELPELIDEVLA